MADKKCPKCGLWNSEIAEYCDCGYLFFEDKCNEKIMESTSIPNLVKVTKEQSNKRGTQAPETKVCPYCAETIKYKAIICRYCGKDLQNPIIINPMITVTTEGNDDIGLRSSIIFGLLLFGIYLAGIIILFYAYNQSQACVGFYQLISSMIFVGLALENHPKTDRGCRITILYFVISILPIIGWVIIFLSGKGLARIVFGKKY